MAVETSHNFHQAMALPLQMEPVAFDGLFGWFSPGISRRGVILCGTHGFEQLSAHRSWRTLGERIAATGCATLRFDYPGEGDSGDLGSGRVESWLRAIRRAIRYLREEAGSEEIVLVGLRLGGTLAALAAEGEAVDRVALLAPFASGRAYLRELKLQSRTIGVLPDGAPLTQEEGVLNVGGFRICPDLATDLSALDLKAPARPPAPSVLLLGAEASGLAKRYAALGSDVTALPFPGLAQLLANPLFAVAPEDSFARVVDFVAQGALPSPAPLRAPSPSARIEGPAWSEEPQRLGADLFGILCRPYRAVQRHPTVLFVNAGTNPHSGWGRQTTANARRLASEGIASLRLDLRGIGDSPDRPSGASPLYSLDPLDDVRAALDHLDAIGLGPVVIVGACSGAHLGFQAVCREPRLAGALLINPYCFDWNPDDDVETVIRNVFRSNATYLNMLRQGTSWRRLLRGEIRGWAIGVALARTARARLGARLARLVRPAPAGGTVAQRIAMIRQRGARIRLVYSAGDRGLQSLHEHLGRTPERIAQRLGEPVVVIDGVDHDLSTAAAQEELYRTMRIFLLEGAESS
ncbi:alpha/beta hydrolase family protein [Methylobacterium brachythecii]|uniref:Alpha-beta hydrolase superfamily lysophospholipase n=1 Tax=Methylobacterium brachythecii TaxID=1176177 RepID=A0A7W6AF16_9HYPH|nr:alpha/beta hydrolase family protein [Methylobacterium brachythecii]MBB3901528.1 alpha-beta hydrolase superfamily lysophospholipase [Methylobacterium brachythecii]GLS43098.1 hypothetical protein GCM10007884_10830 [Methylobacterium brachythecii]